MPVGKFTEYENPAAFDMLVPQGWRSEIIAPGIIAFAEPESLNLGLEEPAPSMVVFRQEPDGRFELNEHFDHYLESGPLRTGFKKLNDINEFKLGGRDGFAADVVLNAEEQSVRSFVVSTETVEGFNYYFTATAPDNEWDNWWPTFQAMIGSITFNE